MQRRLWLNVPGYQVQDIKRDRFGCIYLNIRLGNVLVVRGVTFEIEDMNRSIQNWAMADTILVDRANFHDHAAEKVRILRDILMIAVGGCCSRLAWALESDPPKTELEFIKPREWKGKSLKIPVDFVKLIGFKSRGVRVYADVCIGHHVIVRMIEIFDGQRFGLDSAGQSTILDLGLRQTIGDLLRRRSVRKAVRDISLEGKIDSDQEFMIGVKGCDPEAVPPRIQFR